MDMVTRAHALAVRVALWVRVVSLQRTSSRRVSWEVPGHSPLIHGFGAQGLRTLLSRETARTVWQSVASSRALSKGRPRVAAAPCSISRDSTRRSRGISGGERGGTGPRMGPWCLEATGLEMSLERASSKGRAAMRLTLPCATSPLRMGSFGLPRDPGMTLPRPSPDGDSGGVARRRPPPDRRSSCQQRLLPKKDAD